MKPPESRKYRWLVCGMRDAEPRLINPPDAGPCRCCICGDEFPRGGDPNHSITKGKP